MTAPLFDPSWITEPSVPTPKGPEFDPSWITGPEPELGEPVFIPFVARKEGPPGAAQDIINAIGSTHLGSRFLWNFQREITFGYKGIDLPPAKGLDEIITDTAGSLAGVLAPLAIPIAGTQIGLARLAIKFPTLVRGLRLGISAARGAKAAKAARVAQALTTGAVSNIVGFNVHGQAYKHPDAATLSDRLRETLPTTLTALAFTSVGGLSYAGPAGRVLSYPAIGTIGYTMTQDDEGDPLNSTRKIVNALALMILHRGIGNKGKEIEKFVNELYPNESPAAKKRILDDIKAAEESVKKDLPEAFEAEPVKPTVREKLAPPPKSQDRSKMIQQASILERGRVDIPDIKEFKEQHFGKRSKTEFSLEELQQYIDLLKSKAVPKTTRALIDEAGWSIVRRQIPDKPTGRVDPYEASIHDRVHRRMEKVSKKGTTISQWKPMEDAVGAMGDPTAFAAYQAAMSQAHEGRALQLGTTLRLHKAIKAKGGPKSRAVYRSDKFTERVVEAHKTGKADDPQVWAVAQAVKEMDEGSMHLTRAARLITAFKRPGVKDFVPRDLDSKKFLELEKRLQRLMSEHDYDTAVDMFAEEMKGESFGVRKDYYPTRHYVEDESQLLGLLGPERLATPTGRYKVGEGVADPRRYWSWVGNKVYRDYMVLHGEPRLSAMVQALTEVNPDNYWRLKPFVRSMYRFPIERLPGISALAGMAYTSWLTLNLWPDVRNLGQNIAKQPWIPSIHLVGSAKKALSKFTPEQKKWFKNIISQQGGVEEGFLLTDAVFKNVPGIRRVETLIKKAAGHYALSDEINRRLLTGALLPLEESLVKPWGEGKVSTRYLFKRLKIEQMDDVTKLYLLDALKTRPDEFMAEYIAQKMNDVHFQYRRPERPMFMQTAGGRPFSGLLVFPISTLSKFMRQGRILFAKETPSFGRRQAGTIILNQTAQIWGKWIARALAVVAGSEVVGTLTSEDKRAYLKVKAEDIYKTMSWLVPSLFANNLVKKITGKPSTYGIFEMKLGSPLEVGVLSDLTDDVIFPMMQWANGEAAAKDVFFHNLERFTTRTIPLLDAMAVWMSVNYDMLNGELFSDFIPAIAHGLMTAGEMREWKLEFDEEIDRRFKFRHHKGWDRMDILRDNLQRVLFRGERSGRRLRDQAVMDLVYNIILEDVAGKLIATEPEAAEEIKAHAQEYWDRFEESRKYVAQQLPKAYREEIYMPSRETVRKQLEEAYE